MAVGLKRHLVLFLCTVTFNYKSLNKCYCLARTMDASNVNGPHAVSPVNEAWKTLRPVVQCGNNLMTLTAKGRGYTHMLVDRGNAPPLPLSQLPFNCGYSVKTTWRDFILAAPYNGCYVKREEGNYVLSLLWWGITVRMSCPITTAPPSIPVSVFCVPYGMTMKADRKDLAEKLSIRLKGRKVPFLSTQCGYGVESISGEVNLYIPYTTCKIALKGGTYALSILFEEQEIAVSCPVFASSLFSRPLTQILAPATPPTGSTDYSQFTPSITCTADEMTVTLASARPDSVRVGWNKMWIPIKNAPPNCGYKLKPFGRRGVTFISPLPGCHSHSPPFSLSIFLKFWDTLHGKERVWEFQCPDSHPSLPFSFPSQAPLESYSPVKPQVLCAARYMSVVLPPGPVEAIRLVDTSGNEIYVKDAPEHCGYAVDTAKNGSNTLILPVRSCHVTIQEGDYKIYVKFQFLNGQVGRATLSCPVVPCIAPQGCSLSRDQRITCGPRSVSPPDCCALGCCFASHSGTCYYPMDECTVDRHLVFSVASSLTNPPLSPASLFVAGNSTCTPERVTSSFALFKVPLDGCGVHRYEVGQAVVYMLEVLNTLRSIRLNYGTITRDPPLRLVVECRYVPSSEVSVGYLVKTPSLSPSIKAPGIFGVQLRIATDGNYTSYYPQYHRPLQLLLGKPLHLEVRLLNPPDPNVVLLVHYCVAYPRSAKSAWVLIYDGCPNPLDSTPHHTPLSPLGQTRRFTMSTFQFLQSGNYSSSEEIYFMCSTEVCLPSEGPCVEECFDSPQNRFKSSSVALEI